VASEIARQVAQGLSDLTLTAAGGGAGAEGFVGGYEAVAVGVKLLEFFGDVGVPLGGVFGHGDLAVAVGIAAGEPGVEPFGEQFGRRRHAIAGFGRGGFAAARGGAGGGTLACASGLCIAAAGNAGEVARSAARETTGSTAETAAIPTAAIPTATIPTATTITAATITAATITAATITAATIPAATIPARTTVAAISAITTISAVTTKTSIAARTAISAGASVAAPAAWAAISGPTIAATFAHAAGHFGCELIDGDHAVFVGVGSFAAVAEAAPFVFFRLFPICRCRCGRSCLACAARTRGSDRCSMKRNLRSSACWSWLW
jgi:hypothetical protein